MIKDLLYIDPGSGSYLIQVVIAAVLGAVFWIKMFWQQIKSFFGGHKIKSEKEEEKGK